MTMPADRARPDDHRATPALGTARSCPPDAAIAAQHPLPAPGARLTGGLLHDWQRRNAAASMPLALHQLVVAGNLDNLQLAIRAADQETAGQGHRRRPQDARATATVPGGRAPARLGPVDPRRPRLPRPGLHGLRHLQDPGGHRLGARVRAPAGTAAAAAGQETTRDQALSDFAATTIGLLDRAQRPDGYLNSYVQASGEPRYAELASSHEMYCDGHLIQAAIALARGAGRRRPRWTSRSGSPTTWSRSSPASARAWTATRSSRRPWSSCTARRAPPPTVTWPQQFVEQRGHGLAGDSGFGRRYLQDHLPVRERTTEVGHAVRALYLEAGVTDVATETGDARAARRLDPPLGGHGRQRRPT